MTYDSPFFSVLIPSYNRPNELRRCLESVLSSDCDDYEIVVSDDNSPRSEEIREVIDSFDSEKIRFFRQSRNLREPGNKNFLVSQAAGRYNIILGDDDTLDARSLYFLKEYIRRKPMSDIYGLGYNIVDEVGNFISNHASTKSLRLEEFRSRTLALEAGLLPMALFHPATFCCRTGLEKEMPYREDVGIGEDLCFLLEALLAKKSIQIVPRAVFNWRKVQDTESVSQGNQSGQFLASFVAKQRMYNVLASCPVSDYQIRKHILSPSFRFKFMYLELMRLKDVTSVDLDQHMDQGLIVEYKRLKKSAIWRLYFLMVKPIRVLQLCSLVGTIHAFRILFRRKLNKRLLTR